TNTIYSDIVQSIGKAKGVDAEDANVDVASLAAALLTLEDRCKAFARFDLISPLNVGAMVDTLRSSTGSTRRILLEVLTPYVNGIGARLAALQDVQTLMQTFVDTIHSFFTSKTVAFTLRDGLRISAKSDQVLALNMLSSGERQLLLLFCNAVTA